MPIRRIATRVAAAIITVAIGITACATGTAARQFTAASRDAHQESSAPSCQRAMGERIYDAVQRNFGQWGQTSRREFDRAYQQYRVALPLLRVRADCDMAAMALVASLHSGHTSFRDNKLEAERGRLPLSASALKEGWVVTESAIGEIHVGDILTSIDDVPTERWFQNKKRYVFASSDRDARTNFFHYIPLFPQPFSVRLQDGRSLRIYEPGTGTLPRPEPRAEGCWLSPGTAYLKIPTFATARVQRDALALLAGLGRALKLIVDLRGNSGGPPGFEPIALLESLLLEPRPHWIETRTETPEAQAGRVQEMPDPSMPLIDPAAAFRGRLFVLTDRMTASIGEDFVMGLKESGRATVIGETTAGTFAHTITLDLGDGLTVNIATSIERFPDGAAFEGRGIVPHVEVRTSAADLRAGIDRPLDAAEALARDYLADGSADGLRIASTRVDMRRMPMRARCEK